MKLKFKTISFVFWNKLDFFNMLFSFVLMSVVGQLEKYSDAIVRGHETRTFRDFNEIELVFQKQGKWFRKLLAYKTGLD